MKKVLLVCGLFVSLVSSPLVSAEEQEVDNSIQVSSVNQETVGLTESSTVVVENESQSAQESVTATEESQTNENTTINEDADQQESDMSINPQTITSGGSPVFRLYDPNSGHHFFTLRIAERDHLVRVGWRYEGIAWKEVPSGDPVYRVYNPNSGEHFFTMSASEKNSIVKAGWVYEGVGFKAKSKKVGTATVPVYRLFNPNARNGSSHHYTTSSGEKTNLQRAGWRYEIISFWTVK